MSKITRRSGGRGWETLAARIITGCVWQDTQRGERLKAIPGLQAGRRSQERQRRRDSQGREASRSSEGRSEPGQAEEMGATLAVTVEGCF